jgi:hypothetical protein
MVVGPEPFARPRVFSAALLASAGLCVLATALASMLAYKLQQFSGPGLPGECHSELATLVYRLAGAVAGIGFIGAGVSVWSFKRSGSALWQTSLAGILFLTMGMSAFAAMFDLTPLLVHCKDSCPPFCASGG